MPQPKPSRRPLARAVVAAAGVAVAAAAAWAGRRRRARPVAAVRRTSTVGRTAGLATVGLRSGVAHVVHRARKAVVHPERHAALDEAHQLRTAEQVAEALGHMKGAFMKLGQMASYLDEGLPEPMRDALAALQHDAPPMAPELVASVIRSELGADPRSVFARFDPAPVAAASIGQVHRARTHDGRDVAVKVQYPGVDDAIRADLNNADLMFRAIGMVFPGLDPEPVVEELRARLVEELDYSLEAGNQTLFADYFDGHPYIRVPRVVPALSTPRVLTTEFADGERFAAVEQWSHAERDLAAEAIFRFVFRSIYRLHAFNGDPHPGNYLFHGGGHVTFLDFGLVKRYDASDVALFSDLIVAIALERDIPRFRRTLEQHEILRAGAPFGDDDVYEYFGHFYDFVLEDRPVTFDPEFASQTVRRFFDVNGPYAHVAKAANVPPAFVITQRINLGLHAVLGRLRATANWRRIAEELWPFVDGPPSTPMGEAEAEWLRRRQRASGTQLPWNP